MSKKSPIPTQQLKLDLAIDFTAFIQNIKSNFTVIWQTLNRQAEQIETIKSDALINQHNRLKSSRRDSRSENRKGINNVSLNYSEMSQEEKPKQNVINPENGMARSQIIPGENDKTIQPNQQANKSKKLIQDLARNLKPTESVIIGKTNQADKSNIAPPEPEKTDNKVPVLPQIQNKEQQKEPQTTDQSQLLQLIQNKILQMNERLQKIELGSIRQNNNFSKKINLINNQVDRCNEALNKRQAQIKKVEFQIDKFRGELSQYKLKKQSQIMRLANNVTSSTSSSSSREYNEFMMEKIQELSNIIPLLMVKADFDQYKAETKIQLARMERKIGDMVSNEEFQGLMAILSRKKSDTGKINRQNSAKSPTDPSKKQTEIVLDQSDPMLQFKIITLQKQLKDLAHYQKQNNQHIQQKILKQSQILAQTNAKLADSINQISRTQQKSLEYEQFMRNMNDSYNEKIKQIINQIVECQESIQKLNNQMKFYSYTNKNPANSDTQVGPTSHSSGVFADSSKITDLENDVNILKKKVNKVTLKLQSLKEDLLTVRQDFARDNDGVKSLLEKKCDWESLKKGMNYFDEKVKQIIAYIEALQKNMSEPQENGQSTAAKKGWTCLCCDKDIKQYQGKLGEAKFTSIFPSRYESPRIGGYFKQKQGQKEYNQLFLKHNRRLSQNHTKSRDQII